MFEITVFKVDTITMKDGSKIYRLWFALDTGIAWLYSKQEYSKGQNARLELFPMNKAMQYQCRERTKDDIFLNRLSL